MNDESKTKTQLISELTQLRKKVTELESTEGKYRSLFENSPVGIYQSTPTGLYRLVNPTFAHMIGFASPEEMLNEVKNISTLYDDPSDREEIKRLFAEQGQINGHAIRHKRRDGQLRWMSIYGKSVYDDAGEIIYYDGFALDITERKQAEKSLRDSEVRFAIIFHASPVAIALTRLSDNQLIDVNKAWLDLTGYEKEEVIGVGVQDLNLWANPEDRAQLIKSLGEQGTVEAFEFQMRKNSGEAVDLLFSAELIELEGEAHMVSMALDISERKRIEEQLSESEERFRATFEQAAAGIAHVNVEGRWLLVNQKLCDIVGYTQDELLTKTFQEITYPDDLETDLQLMQQLLAGKIKTYSMEKRYIRKDDSLVWINLTISLVRKPNGEPKYFVSVIQDITERKRVEKALLENQKRYEKAQAMGHVGNWEYDPVTTNFWGSDEAKRIYGFKLSAEEFTTDNVENCIPERERVHQALIDLIEHDKKYDLEFDIITKDKGLRKTIHSIAEAERDLQGNPLKITGVISDITDRKQAERLQKQMTLRLEQQANQLQMVMDSVPEGVLVINSHGRILLTNPTAQDDLALLADGCGVGDLVTELGGQPINVLLTHPPEGFWHSISWQNRNFELIAKPLKDNDTTGGWVIVIRDITIEKEIQERVQQQERLASVGQLASGIAHDFNNIMAIISLYADLSLKETRLPADMIRRFDIIKTQAGRATNLIQQILDFGRRSVMERLPMDLIPFLKELVKLFERTLPEDIAIYLDYTENNFLINGDPTRLQQVFMNLIMNARDAMPDGGRLQIDLERVKANQIHTGMLPDLTLKHEQIPKDWVRLTIQDTGTGIPPEAIPHIFEPFYTTKEPGKGTGLGLAQVFGIIKQHDGEIDVITEVGKGSAFIIDLPLMEATDSINEVFESEKFSLGQGETILVVEDNPGMQQVLIDSLANLNYRTLAAANGQEALDILNEYGDEITLVLTDLVMPERGGKFLLEAMNQAGMTTKVIIITGHPMGEEKKMIKALGVFDWLNKPLSLEKLAQVVARALEKA